ncbi:unnamed protein product [Brachionus calyciflorus]|uniref:Uncharacterized protein n=1 Tax=Brachionus calyciflorus TaxID=104777 RepID=A0A813USS1_9BILA|nr:unnamed protein product [Brachionus calyciflorus]
MISDRFQRRSSSVYSTASSSTVKNNSDVSKQDDLSEILRNQRIKQFKNLAKLEQLQNPSQIASLNSLQDSDLKELTQFIDIYFNNCFKEINSVDNVLSVSINNLIGKNENYLVKLECLQPIDFLKNGIKSGNPLLNISKPDKNLTTTSSLTSLPRIISPKSSIVSLNKLQTAPVPSTVQQTVLNLNYLLVINLNRDYFSIEQENFNFFKIKTLKKPIELSFHDFDQISIEIKQEKKPTRLSNRSKTNYLQPKSVRYLNARALVDRIIRYFNHVLKYNWPNRHKIISQSQPKIQQNEVQNEISNDDNDRKCYIKNNQIVISFNFNGYKTLKDAKINIYIDLAVKLEDKDQVINNVSVHKSILDILNQYSKDSALDLLDEDKLNRLSIWLLNTFNFNINLIYLTPTYLHLWNVQTKLAKLSTLKFLIWFDSIRLNYTNLTSINDVYILSPQAFKQNFFQTIQNSSGPLFMYVKLMQLFLTTCFTILKEDPNIEGNFEKEFYESDLLMFENEDLLLNLILTEIKNQGVKWSTENLLDRLWISLTNLRSYLFITSHLPDPFDRLGNRMPKFYLKCTGFLNLNTSSTNQIYRNKIFKALSVSFETTMKTVLTKVITEEIDFTAIERSISEIAKRNGATVASPVEAKDLNKTIEQYRNEKNTSNAATGSASQKTE